MIGSRLTETSIHHNRLVAALAAGLTILIALTAALPSLLPRRLGMLNPIEVDTDPENMLSADEPVRVFHRRMKETLALHDIVVVGVVNETHPDGVFNVETLGRIYELTQFAQTLTGGELGAEEGQGVVRADLIAPSTVDSLEPEDAGSVSFSWLMPQPPESRAEALEIWRKARRVPFLDGTLISDSDPDDPSKAIALYLPLTKKDLSHTVYLRIREFVSQFGPVDDEFHITGLPVAEDTFGVEMFIQMAISAPTAMVVIFVLLLVFFRKLVLIVSPMLVAMMSVIFTMGSLIIAGYPVHIMSSMIPIFIMPIAVLDSIHIISEFFEKYQATRDRAKTVRAVMDELFMPMLYTSLTSAAGFASLALTPIPPVQIFGVFVALGILVAWLLTVTFIPAYVMFIRPETLENFGSTHQHVDEERETLMSRAMRWTGSATYRRAKPILAATLIVLAVAGYGISRININDNPVKWFSRSHDIRIADEVLNRHFAGTYMAYLALSADDPDFDADTLAEEVAEAVAAEAEKARPADPTRANVLAEMARVARSLEAESRSQWFEKLLAQIDEEQGPAAAPAPESPSGSPALPGGLDAGGPALPGGLEDLGDQTRDEGPQADRREAWQAAERFIEDYRAEGEIFRKPETLEYLVRLQDHLVAQNVVGKVNSLADIVRTVYRDLRMPAAEKDNPAVMAEYYELPETRPGIAETLINYQQSHRYNDLFHFVTPDFRTTSLWVQLKSGDNQDMSRVVAATNRFVRDNPPPAGLRTPKWFGLTYINVEWQDKMVRGMLTAFAGSFLVVFLLMTILFRSALWGLLSMIPLTVTIGAIYGAVGLIGKDYDMPTAVLSSLTLGLAVDFAIHFLARARAMYAETGSWKETAPKVFGEPARAILRNIIVIAAGFLPLLLAPLMPYKTVGILLATILLVSGAGTLLILPALVTVLEKRLFVCREVMSARCNCATCGISALALVALIIVSIQPYVDLHWTTLTWVSAAAVVAMAVTCGVLSRRQRTRRNAQEEMTHAS